MLFKRINRAYKNVYISKFRWPPLFSMSKQYKANNKETCKILFRNQVKKAWGSSKSGWAHNNERERESQFSNFETINFFIFLKHVKAWAHLITTSQIRWITLTTVDNIPKWELIKIGFSLYWVLPLWNWSRIQDTANHISHITDINHKPYASWTGWRSL